MNSIDRELLEAAADNDNSVPEVRRLLKAGADVNACRFGTTPLIIASTMGHVQVFKELLEHGADIEAKDRIGRTALHFACANGQLAVVELLGCGVGMDANNDSKGATSILGKRKSRGADIEAKDNQGDTPLHLASSAGHFPVVKALLGGGASILAANNNGLLPVGLAVIGRKLEVAKYLFQQTYATTRRLPLHELMQDLTRKGFYRYGNDIPQIRYALNRNVLVADDVVEIIEYLVGRNPTLLRSRDQDGSLPLHVACRGGASFTIIQSLVNVYKASVKSVTPQGDLPLFLACEMPKTSLDTIFLLMKLYPELVYR
jgi:ankyrin repeat protein